MALRKFLRDRKITVKQFADEIGESESLAAKWVYGQRQPSLPCAILIEDYTGGKVTVRDLVFSTQS